MAVIPQVRSRASALVIPFGISSCAAAGALVGTGSTGFGLAFLGAAGAFAVAASALVRGLFATLVVLLLIGVSINGLPGPSVGGLTVLTSAALLPVIGWYSRLYWRRVPRLLWWVGGLSALWWLFAVGRGLSLGAPLRPTYEMSYDLGLWPVLTPLFAAAFMDPRLRRNCILGVTVLGVYVAITDIAAAVNVIPADGLLVHAYKSYAVGSVTRIYSLAIELPTVLLPFAIARFLTATSPRHRRIAAGLAILFLMDALISLVRVKYGGIVVSVGIGTALWVTQRAILRRAVLIMASLVLLGVGANAIPQFRAPIADVTTRFATIFQTSGEREAYEGTDTQRFRSEQAAQVRDFFGPTEWLVGFGFRPSPWYDFPPDPRHQLRNPDLGWYNALTTMGLVGVFLFVAPFLVVLRELWGARTQQADRWLILGGTIFVVYSLAVVGTLVSAAGLLLASLVIGASLSAVSRVDPEATKRLPVSDSLRGRSSGPA